MPNMGIYKGVCEPKFEKIEAGQKELSEDIRVIREKLFNGFSERVERIDAAVTQINEREEMRKRSRSSVIRNVVLSLIGTGGIISLIIDKLL